MFKLIAYMAVATPICSKGVVNKLNYSEFGAEARKIMLIKGITMASLARELGISPYYLGEILKGTRPGKKYKSRISEILDLEGK